MTPLYHATKSDWRWFVRAFALLIIGVPAVAQQANVSAPLTADEVDATCSCNERRPCQGPRKLFQCPQLSPGVSLSFSQGGRYDGSR